MDRSLATLLQLPVFDEPFVRALCRLGLGRSEFWLALDGDEGPDEQIARMLGVMGGDQDDRDDVLRRIELVPLLFSLVRQSKDRIMAEIATDLGYGMGSAVRPGGRADPPSSSGLRVTPVPSIKKPRMGNLSDEVTSLKAEEEKEQIKWAARLQAIAARAGDHARINKPIPGQQIPAQGQAEIRSLVFSSGAFRTIRVNVLVWERMEKWAASVGVSVFPLTDAVFTRYCLHLQTSNCGPSVLPALKYAVKWICKRLAMDPPDIESPQIGAVINRVYQDRDKELKEAVAVPLPVVSAMEYLVNALILEEKIPAALFVWWTLILIYASLRWDDGRHVAPTSLVLTEDALLGLIWQTKVERKRRGTRFAVPRCSLSGIAWLDEGWKIFQVFKTDRDFFIWDLISETEFDLAPISYPKSLPWLRYFAQLAIDVALADGVITHEQAEESTGMCHEITWHSLRATLLSAAVKSQVDDKIIVLQANWKDPSQLVLKYARQRKELSVRMVQDLAAQIRAEWTPDPKEFEVEDDVDVVDPSPCEYVVKSSLPPRALVSSDLRYHIKQTSINSTHTHCAVGCRFRMWCRSAPSHLA